MSRDTRNNTTALAVILIITGMLVGCYACAENHAVRVRGSTEPPCGKQTDDLTGVESWGSEWPPCPHKAMLAESARLGR